MDLVLQAPMTGATYIMLQNGSEWSPPAMVDPGLQFSPLGDLVSVGVGNFDRVRGDDIVYVAEHSLGCAASLLAAGLYSTIGRVLTMSSLCRWW
jgi:hypothetical protein